MKTSDIFFWSNHNFQKSLCGLCFWAPDILVDRFFLKGLKPKNKGHTNFYECCDLRRNIYLVYLCGLSNRKQLQC